MRCGGLRVARVAYCSKCVARTYERAGSYYLVLQVCVVQPHVVRWTPHPDHLAAEAVLPDCRHKTVARGEDGCAAGREDVDAFMAAAARVTLITIDALDTGCTATRHRKAQRGRQNTRHPQAATTQ